MTKEEQKQNNDDEEFAKELATDLSDNEKEYGMVLIAVNKTLDYAKKRALFWRLLKAHEQALLWYFQSILDEIVTDPETYKTALEKFKSELINKF